VLSSYVVCVCRYVCVNMHSYVLMLHYGTCDVVAGRLFAFMEIRHKQREIGL